MFRTDRPIGQQFKIYLYTTINLHAIISTKYWDNNIRIPVNESILHKYQFRNRAQVPGKTTLAYNVQCF